VTASTERMLLSRTPYRLATGRSNRTPCRELRSSAVGVGSSSSRGRGTTEAGGVRRRLASLAGRRPSSGSCRRIQASAETNATAKSWPQHVTELGLRPSARLVFVKLPDEAGVAVGARESGVSAQIPSPIPRRSVFVVGQAVQRRRDEQPRIERDTQVCCEL
jgi:hypothetical protein